MTLGGLINDMALVAADKLVVKADRAWPIIGRSTSIGSICAFHVVRI